MPHPAPSVCLTPDADDGFDRVLGSASAPTEERLAELIEADGRARLRRGRPVTLARYLAAVPDLFSRPDALDAAIDVALRSLSGSARITPQAIDALVQEHPGLEHAIREAATLNAALWSTTGLRNRVAPPPIKPLPCDFGPRLADGESRYLLQELLGQGSFGQVYKALDRQLSEKGHAAVVAIKVLVNVDRSPVSRQRLFDEATKARRVSHPNVAQVLDRGTTEAGEDFIVYEHIDGGDLSERAWELPMPPHAAASLVAKLARGVHAAHNAGLIHCDLKPSNIMLTAGGEPKVADFGIAVRLDDEGKVDAASSESVAGPIGNIAFISPEQFRNEDGWLSVKSDVYALGGMLFHVLTGRLPNGATRPEIAATHDATSGRTTAPSPRERASRIDDDLDAICRRALAPNPAERYDSAAALAADLEHWMRLEPLEWRNPSLRVRVGLWARRRPALAAASGVILLLILAGAAVANHFAALATQRAEDARIAQMDAREKQREKELREELGGKVMGALKQVAGDERERFVTDVMMQIWVFEHIYGPSVLGSPERVNQLWERRIETARGIIESRTASGQGDSLETLLWESMLGFWLTSRGEHAQAIALLDRNIERWRVRCPEDDPWLTDLQTMRLCAEVSRWSASGAGALTDSSQGATRLAELDTALQASAIRLANDRPRSPLHYLVVRRLIDLTGPDILNDAPRQSALAAELKALLDGSQQARSGIKNEVRRTNQAIERKP
jgi:hypothetical protein